ncbi:MAG: bifunctional 2',3'-cyclic-nucleotide 2'-phosphodiesterase/3'-nucleotidase [Inquilinaceae bacterium]
MTELTRHSGRLCASVGLGAGIGLAAAAAFLAVAGPAGAEPAQVDLRVMETTDVHVHIQPYDYYRDRADDTVGLAKTASLIAAARAEVANSLLFDNGDLIQGNPMGDYMATVRGVEAGDVHPVYKAMNLIDYDAGNLGNHEFNYGIDYLERVLAGAAFPYVSANVVQADGDDDPWNNVPFIDPYILLERTLTDRDRAEHPITIGVIGFVPPQIVVWDRAHLEGRLESRDIVETAERLVPEMRAAGADIVVAIPHSGFTVETPEGRDENASFYLSAVDGIDAILFGHAHRVFPGEDYEGMEGVDAVAGTLNGVPSVMPGFWGSHLGIVDLALSVEDGVWSVDSATVEARPIYRRDGREVVALVDPDPAILDAVAEEHAATLDFVREAVGRTTAPITSYFALVADDPSIQIVTDAQKWYVETLVQGSEYDGIPVLSAGAPFKAGGRGGPDYYTDVAAGEIAIKNVADLYLYPNTVRAVLLTGAQVKDWLEMSANMFNTIDPAGTEDQALINPDFPSFNFDVIDGLTYRIDVTRPPKFDTEGGLANPDSSRIVDLRYQGQPVDPDQKFIVATNNYRAGGGGGFPHLDGSNIIVEAPDANRDVIVRYLLEKGEIDPSADDNWRLAPIAGPAKVSFETGPAAQAHITGRDDIEYLETLDSGFAKYRLDLGN